MSLSSDIDAYFAARKAIHEAFKYPGMWREVPMDDLRDSYWILDEYRLTFSPEPFTEESLLEGKKIYSSEVWKTYHLKKYVFHAEGLTMVVVDTRTDGNVFLSILRDELRCTDDKLVTLASR